MRRDKKENKAIMFVFIMRHFKMIFLHFGLPISGGALIYILFRPMQIIVFQLLDLLGFESQIVKARALVDISKHLPDWVVYSLPGGFWAYSFMFFISFIWGDKKRLGKNVFTLLVVVLALGSELGQLFGVVPGTFCLADIATYAIGLLLGYIYGSKYPNENITKRSFLFSHSQG